MNLIPIFSISVKKIYPKKKKQIQDSDLEVVGGSNNENWPPEGSNRGRINKKRYVVNKKRTDQQSFDRLKKHVPTLEGKDDASQLDILMEAIQYIQALRKDLGKEDTQPPPQPRQLQPFKSSDVN